MKITRVLRCSEKGIPFGEVTGQLGKKKVESLKRGKTKIVKDRILYRWTRDIMSNIQRELLCQTRATGIKSPTK